MGAIVFFVGSLTILGGMVASIFADITNGPDDYVKKTPRNNNHDPKKHVNRSSPGDVKRIKKYRINNYGEVYEE